MSTALTPELRDNLLTQLVERTTSPGYHYLSAEHLTELAALESPEAPVVSLFMELTPEMRLGGSWQIAFKDLQRRALERAGEGFEAADVRRELERIEAALGGRLPRTGRGLVFYACEPLGLFRQYGVAIPLPNAVHVNRSPYVRPLARVRDEHDRFGLVLVSQKEIRFFFSQIGLVEEVFSLDGREILTSGFASKDQRQDKQQEYRREQAQRAAHATQLLSRELGVRHLLYACPPDMETAFLEALDQATRARVAASFQCDVGAPVAEVAARAEPLQRDVERREELETVERVRQLLTGRAVAGLGETLDMLNHQRVMTLVIDDEGQIPGGIDRQTGMLTTLTEGTHPATGNPISPEPDLFELMLERALEQGAELELLRSPAARARLRELGLGPCAALLRF